MESKELYTSKESLEILRCPECDNIPLITPRFLKDKALISYSCSNNHKGDKELSQFKIQSTNHSIFLRKCEECNLEPEKSEKIFSYCTFEKCKKILCNKCKKNHKIQNHKTCSLRNYDSTCLIHNHEFISFCKTCQKNICFVCKKEHSMHNIIELYHIIPQLNSDESNKFEKLNNEISKHLENLKILKESIIESLKRTIKKTIDDLNKYFEKYEKWMKERINNANIFIQSSFTLLKQENIRFEILHNLKFLNDILIGFPNVNNFEDSSIRIKAEKLISFFKLSLEQKSVNNLQIVNTPQSQNYSIQKIIEFPNGYFLVCFNNGNLWLYKNNTFEIKLKINDLGINSIYDAILLKNGKIGLNDGRNYFIILDIEPQHYKILQKEELYNNYSICELTNNSIIIGHQYKYSIYKQDKEEDGIKYYLYKINSLSYDSYDIKQISNNEFVILSLNELTFVNFENENYTTENLRNYNFKFSTNSNCIYLINSEFFGVAGDGIYIFKISDHTFIQKFGSSRYCNFYKLLDGTFVCGDSLGNIEEYKYEGQNILIKIGKKKKVSNSQITIIYQLIDGKIITGSSDGSLIVWN